MDVINGNSIQSTVTACCSEARLWYDNSHDKNTVWLEITNDVTFEIHHRQDDNNDSVWQWRWCGSASRRLLPLLYLLTCWPWLFKSLRRSSAAVCFILCLLIHLTKPWHSDTSSSSSESEDESISCPRCYGALRLRSSLRGLWSLDLFRPKIELIFF